MPGVAAAGADPAGAGILAPVADAVAVAVTGFILGAGGAAGVAAVDVGFVLVLDTVAARSLGLAGAVAIQIGGGNDLRGSGSGLAGPGPPDCQVVANGAFLVQDFDVVLPPCRERDLG